MCVMEMPSVSFGLMQSVIVGSNKMENTIHVHETVIIELSI